jgi:AAA+ ATPase superfamily predicted ATPase
MPPTWRKNESCPSLRSVDSCARSSMRTFPSRPPSQEASKRINRQVREWARIAHERDLRNALGELLAHFKRWDLGEIDAFELNERVHRFHQDTSREIWKRYATTHLEPAVASAVATGVLRKEELTPELLQHIAGLIEFYERDLSAS